MDVLSILLLILTFVASAPLLASSLEKEKLTLGIWGTPAEIFKKQGNKVFCPTIEKYIQPDEKRRDLIDLLIFCQAFNQVKLIVEFDLVISTEYQKAITIVKNDFAKSVSFTVWREDINPDDFYYSKAVIKSGEYQKGLYTLPDHPLQSQPVAKNTNILKNYSIVTVKNWVLDNLAATDITDNVALSSSHSHLFSMIKAHRADFTLLGFGFGEKMSHTRDGVTLVPISGVKIAFHDSRHFIIKKTAPNGKKLITKLNEGLHLLSESGYIEKLYQSSGLYRENTNDWKILNSTRLAPK